MLAYDIQNSKDSTKVTQNPYIIAQLELEQQADIFIMQAFDLQNSKD